MKEINRNLKNHLVKNKIGYKDKNTHYESVYKYYECIDSKNIQSFKKAHNIALKAYNTKEAVNKHINNIYT